MAFTPIKDPYRQIDWGNPITRGLTAAFRFNEGGGTKVYDIARNRYHGSFLNTPTWGAGIRGKAVNLSGTAQIQLANIPTPATPNGASIVILYKCTSASNLGVVTIGDGTGSGYWGMGINSLAPYMYVSGSSAPTGVAVASGQWVHVVGTFRDTQRLLYQNGLLAASTISGWTPSTPSSRADIGSFGTGQQLQGAIDHVYIFARELSKADVQALFEDPDCIIYRPRRAVLIIPPMSGTGASTFANMTCAGVGTVANSITGTGATTFADLTCAGVGTVANPISGTGAFTFANFTIAGTASYVAPITGTANITFADLAVAGTGTYAIAGTANFTFGALVIAGVGTVVNPITGTGAITFADFTSAGTGTSGIGGSGSATFDNLTIAGVGLYTPVIIGTASFTFDNLTTVGGGGPVTDVNGGGAAHFANLTMVGSGVVVAPVTGTANIQFGSMTSPAGRGGVANPGDTQDYPVHTPAPLLSHNRRFLDRSIVTVMDSGRVRKRRQFDAPLQLLEVKWSFTVDQFEVFKDWFENDLVNGSNTFFLVTYEILDSPYFVREVDWILGFMKPYTWTGSDGNFVVSATLEVVEKAILPTTIDNPTNPPPSELTTPTLEYNFDGFACREMFNIVADLMPLKAHTLEISDDKLVWRPHVFFVVDGTGHINFTFNNDYGGTVWFRIKRDTDDIVVKRPVKPLKAFVDAPTVDISHTIGPARQPYGDMAYNNKTSHNQRLNPHGYFIVPRLRLAYNGGPSLDPDPTPRVVGITGDPAANHYWTRDNRDPVEGQIQPKLDGADNNCAPARSDFGYAIRARSFIPGGCKSPLRLVLLDKIVWQRPWTRAQGGEADESDTCDKTYMANVRTDWTPDGHGGYANPLTPLKFSSGDSCEDLPGGETLREKVLNDTRGGPFAINDQYVFLRGTFEREIDNLAFLGTGDAGDAYIGWDSTQVESATFVASSITYERYAPFWDIMTVCFTYSYLGLGVAGDANFGDYKTNTGEKDTEIICGVLGTKSKIEDSWNLPGEGELQGPVSKFTHPFVAGDDDGQIRYNIYIYLTLHNDNHAPEKGKDVPPVPEPPPAPPAPAVHDHDDFESYPSVVFETTATLNDGVGWAGPGWAINTITVPHGYENWEGYTNQVYADGLSILGFGDGWNSSSKWFFSSSVNIIGRDDFESYVKTTGMNKGTFWGDSWVVNEGIKIYGNETWEELNNHQDVTNDPFHLLVGGTNWLLWWTINSGVHIVGSEDWEAYGAAIYASGVLNFGNNWAPGSAWIFS